MIGAIALLLVCQLAGEVIHRLTGLPLPGAVIGMVLLLAPIWVPLALLLALVIWLQDRASPFYGQERIGRYGVNIREVQELLRRDLGREITCTVS